MKTTQPKGTLREVHKSNTRALILDTSRELFETKGYDQVTIREVAKHARIGLGTIYNHFPNKLAILAAAFLDNLKNLSENALITVPKEQPFKTQFVYISKCFFCFYTEHSNLARTYLSHMFFYHQEWLEPINAFDEIYDLKMAELIRAAQKKGEIGPEKDIESLVLALMSNYFFVLFHGFLRKNISDPDRLAGLLEDLIEHTLS